MAHCELILRALSGNFPPVLSAPIPTVLPGGVPRVDDENAGSRGSDTQRSGLSKVVAQVTLCQGYYFQRFFLGKNTMFCY